MIVKRHFLAVLLLLAGLYVQAAKVDTVLVKSQSMNKEVEAVVVTPDIASGKKAVNCPVIYLLHGYSGNARSWIALKPELPKIADEKGVIFVCPNTNCSFHRDKQR